MVQDIGKILDDHYAAGYKAGLLDALRWVWQNADEEWDWEEIKAAIARVEATGRLEEVKDAD